MTVPLSPLMSCNASKAAPGGGEKPVHAPLLDQIHINQLCVAIGSARFDGLLGLLAKELVERPATIRRAVLDGDLARARRESHSLKGATTSCGAMALGAAAATIEQAPDLPAMAAALAVLDRQAVLTGRAIAKMLPASLAGHGPV